MLQKQAVSRTLPVLFALALAMILFTSCRAYETTTITDSGDFSGEPETVAQTTYVVSWSDILAGFMLSLEIMTRVLLIYYIVKSDEG
ncbi:MAG: hypothetical protein NUW37_16450 [Planctomycetes bacterium]|nr:hypothetical protein [Planctomycetota bacterium]